MAQERFHLLSSQDLQALEESSANSNTTKSTNTWNLNEHEYKLFREKLVIENTLSSSLCLFVFEKKVS